MVEDEIKVLVTRLARPQRSGGFVVERAAIIAEGADSEEVISWITAHGGAAEAKADTSSRHGLHGAQLHPGGGSQSRSPSRFVLPPGALD